jgi:2,3-bisphosphoglycerate-independent phosphoglycerate mutase
MTAKHKPLALIIMDGWGYSESPDNNAIMAAKTPNWDRLWESYPHTLINASGQGVGLPGDQMGNSEVGHLNLGAGRIVYQEFTRISKAIDDGDFFENPILTEAVDLAVKADKAVHIFGLLSDGGVHSHESHIHAMVKLAAQRGADKIYVHAFLDGRDTAPKSAQSAIDALENVFSELGKGRLATLIGRYYAMDRDKRWERVVKAYQLIAEGEGEVTADSASEGLAAAYAREETDEFVKPTTIGDAVKMEDGDSVVFMNFRSDRARELTEAFIYPDFDGFEKSRHIKLARFVTLTEYKKEFTSPIAFPTEKMTNIFGEYLSEHGKTQLRIAETEKYAHVTFFFNGGVEQPFEGEDRILIPSPKVATYDLQPEMNAHQVTDKLVEAIEADKYDVIICNYANADMVGHTGVFDAAVKAIEALDECLGRVWAALEAAGGEMLVTADHGNAERMVNHETGQPHTAHTNNVVPLLFAGRAATCHEGGGLADIAPTMLSLMGMNIPAEMNTKLLVEPQ